MPRDYFAELYVAGLMADAGWNIYFPHRDKGMDFIATKTAATGAELIRPVQVKGKYPTVEKGSKMVYGYVGRLNQTHPDMVLAIPFFGVGTPGPALSVAFMPYRRIRPHARGWRCEPAAFRDGVPTPRREFFQFFDEQGLAGMEKPEWPSL